MMGELNAFRADVRQWLEENCPAEMRQPVTGDDDICWGGRKFIFKNDAQKLWLDRCVAKGYTVPDWPVAYGGAGFTPEQTKIFKQ
jgi:acyl-CoA dehydrogenase